MNKRIKKPVGGILPGEPGQRKPRRPKGLPGVPSKPKPGPGPRPIPMTPDEKYRAMKKAMHTPGMQPGEKEQLQRIMENRGVDWKKARQIGAHRTSLGLGMIGTPNPKNKKNTPGRQDVSNPSPVKNVPVKSGPVSPDAPKPTLGGLPRKPARPPKGGSGASMSGSPRKRLPVKGGK